ncbi:MAG: serine/threonine protein kinase [Planctomycetes bacterium]|nr:serine/threonine protein kinase [Planctomycetota bacterium]
MRDTPSTEPRAEVPDWEAFYASYRKPGYIQGFEIGPKLGGGMFGVVYKARRESIGKSYAIKFLRVEDPGVRDQVLRELGTVGLFAQVDHPNLVSIEDQGIVDGIPFIVMGYAGDETLRDRFEAGRLSEEDALRLFVQVARGVSALHEHSLVHFDLKPANVFLKGDIARVGDYGLSKLITETAMSLSTGRGTPYYMAPEMLRRKGDHRSDIYSLGVILFEALAGEVPFRGDSEWEVLKGHEEKPVVFPAAIPQRYHVILGKALAKRPEDRFASVADMLHALQAPAALGESLRFDLPPGPAVISTSLAPRAIQQADEAVRDAGRVLRDARRQQLDRFEARQDRSQTSSWRSTALPWMCLFGALVFWRSDAVRVGSLQVGLGKALLFVAIVLFLSRRRHRPEPFVRRANAAPWFVLLFATLMMGGCFLWMAAAPAPGPIVESRVVESGSRAWAGQAPREARKTSRRSPASVSALQTSGEVDVLSRVLNSVQQGIDAAARAARGVPYDVLRSVRTEFARLAATSPASSLIGSKYRDAIHAIDSVLDEREKDGTRLPDSEPTSK